VKRTAASRQSRKKRSHAPSPHGKLFGALNSNRNSVVSSQENQARGRILGEIKSTVDLVLEKTRNLTLSEEEKLDLEGEELDKKIRGLVNRYLDNILPLSRLKEEIQGIDSKRNGLALKFLKKHLLAHFDPDRDNTPVLSALSEIAGFDVSPLTKLQKEYQAEKEETERAFKERALLALEERGVSGSAVVPNLSQDPHWNQSLTSLRNRYQERLTTIQDG
jgi:hypothetical protein